MHVCDMFMWTLHVCIHGPSVITYDSPVHTWLSLVADTWESGGATIHPPAKDGSELRVSGGRLAQLPHAGSARHSGAPARHRRQDAGGTGDRRPGAPGPRIRQPTLQGHRHRRQCQQGHGG